MLPIVHRVYGVMEQNDRFIQLDLDPYASRHGLGPVVQSRAKGPVPRERIDVGLSSGVKRQGRLEHVPVKQVACHVPAQVIAARGPASTSGPQLRPDPARFSIGEFVHPRHPIQFPARDRKASSVATKHRVHDQTEVRERLSRRKPTEGLRPVVVVVTREQRVLPAPIPDTTPCIDLMPIDPLQDAQSRNTLHLAHGIDGGKLFPPSHK